MSRYNIKKCAHLRSCVSGLLCLVSRLLVLTIIDPLGAYLYKEKKNPGIVPFFSYLVH